MSATKEKLHDQIEAGMRKKSDHKISWLNMPGYKGETWNPIVGCSKISEGCDNCYAERMAVRICAMSEKKETLSISGYAYEWAVDNGHWSGNTEASDLAKPFKMKAPRMIFVCSMGDLFHESVKEVWQLEVFETIEQCPQHIFIILTKRPQNASHFFIKHPHFENLPNVWLGVTAENQQRANERIPILLQMKAAKRFVSIEPMLGPVDLKSIVFKMSDGNGEFIVDALTGTVFTDGDSNNLDWVICGGETGPKARPMHPDWVRLLRNQCRAAQVPFFFKQWGEWDYQYNLNACRYGEGKAIPIKDSAMVFFKVGHKAAGRALDGVEFNEFPEVK